MHTVTFNKWLDRGQNWITMNNIVVNIIAINIVDVNVYISAKTFNVDDDYADYRHKLG